MEITTYSILVFIEKGVNKGIIIFFKNISTKTKSFEFNWLSIISFEFERLRLGADIFEKYNNAFVNAFFNKYEDGIGSNLHEMTLWLGLSIPSSR
jgi:hypothetical protein